MNDRVMQRGSDSTLSLNKLAVVIYDRTGDSVCIACRIDYSCSIEVQLSRSLAGRIKCTYNSTIPIPVMNQSCSCIKN